MLFCCVRLSRTSEIIVSWHSSFVVFWSLHLFGLSSIQWRAINPQGKPPVGVAWSSCSSMQGLQGEGRGLRYSEQACCDAPVLAVTAQRAGMDVLTIHGPCVSTVNGTKCIVRTNSCIFDDISNKVVQHITTGKNVSTSNDRSISKTTVVRTLHYYSSQYTLYCDLLPYALIGAVYMVTWSRRAVDLDTYIN